MPKEKALVDLLEAQTKSMTPAEVASMRHVLTVTLPQYITQAAMIARKEALKSGHCDREKTNQTMGGKTMDGKKLGELQARKAELQAVLVGIDRSKPGTMSDQAALVSKAERAYKQIADLDIEIAQVETVIKQNQEAERQAVISAKVAAKGKYKDAAKKLIVADQALQVLARSYDELSRAGISSEFIIPADLIDAVHQEAGKAELVLRQIGQ